MTTYIREREAKRLLVLTAETELYGLRVVEE